MILLLAISALFLSWSLITFEIGNHYFMVILYWTSTMAVTFPYWIRQAIISESRLSPILGMVGIVSNGAAIIANGGYMPVLDGHAGTWWVPLDHTSRLIPLTDIVYGGASIGDMLLVGGFIMYMIETLLRQYGQHSKASTAQEAAGISYRAIHRR